MVRWFCRNPSFVPVCLLAAIIGSPASASVTATTSSQQGSLPFTPGWTPASGSLIAGTSPSTATGDFSLDVAGRMVESLTSEGTLTISELPGNNTSVNYLTCGDGYGAGSLLVYTLPASANGYDLTNITVYGGWKDNGRDQQAYTLSYATAASPGVFQVLTSVNYNPPVPTETASATRVTLADSGGGVLVSNVVAVRIDFTEPPCENGYCGYGAITIHGTPASPPAGPPAIAKPIVDPPSAGMGITAGAVVTLSASAIGSIPMGYQWRTDGGSGGALSNMPAATAPELVVDTTGYGHGTYRYDCVAGNALGTNTSPAALIAIVAMADIGASAPTPGLLDISQLANTAQNDDGLNYYTDNGPVYGNWCGQTFTTGNEPSGYLLRSVAWKSAGNGNSFGVVQPYNLLFFSLSPDGSQATLIRRYRINASGTENHWFQWLGLNVPLAANSKYAYTFGRDVSGIGWERIGNQGGNPYPQGQIMTLSHTTGRGPVTYGNAGGSDATFSLGLEAYQESAPRALQPTLASGDWPVYAGNPGGFTLQETPLGSGPFGYQWLTDNGAGGVLTPLAGATSSNLIVGSSNLAVGTWRYAVVVSNAFGSSVSPCFEVPVLGSTAPTLAADISPAPTLVTTVGAEASFSATFTGTAPLHYQWYFNAGFGSMPISAVANPSAASNVLVISNTQLTNDGVYSVIAENAAGATSSGVSTLAVVPPPNAPPPAVTLPPTTLRFSNSPASLSVQWAQGTLQQATNLLGPWIPLATHLEPGTLSVPTTNGAAYFRSEVARQPRIVTLYCFCRDQDYRLGSGSQQILFNATTQQVQLFKQANLPATFALQHDALVDPAYETYFKSQLDTNDEIGAWWEITQTLVEGAGLTWRGDHEWVSTANIAFSPGYTPAERIQLVDTYMADFHSIYGHYPKSVGSWYIDEVTLEYMREQYGVVASANCKDQIGTDSYTLWGGYWNQAYYPSKLNSYMPAQTPAGQIDLPVFRLLGSDPIYQYGNFTPGIYSLEPVYSGSGGSPTWVAWYFSALIKQPSLAYGFTQAGQENSFGWNAMSAGLSRQVALIAAEAQVGNIQVMTLAEAGEWFRENYSVTPPTSVVVLEDYRQEDRKSVWYNSRFYRLNLLWDQGTLYIRDLHCFDEEVTSDTHSAALTTDYFVYETLPVMDGGRWSPNAGWFPGMWPVRLSPSVRFLAPQGMPSVRQLSPTDLGIVQPLSGGGALSMICTESGVTCLAADSAGQPLDWAWELVGGTPQSAAVQAVAPDRIHYHYIGTDYQLRLAAGSCEQLGNGNIRLIPDPAGMIILNPGASE